MTPALLLSLLLWQSTQDPSVIADPQHLRFQRPVVISGNVAGTGQTCPVLDGQIFPHAAPSLRDLRLFSGGRELPYVVTLSEAAQPQGDTARILNLGRSSSGAVEFDLEMPPRPYTEIRLALAGTDFIANATISGTEDLHSGQKTTLGTSTLFDLSTQHLGRSTSLSLPESSFHYLHVVLRFTGAGGGAFTSTPAMVQGAQVPPSREAQTVYTPVARTTSIVQRGRETLATFHAQAHLPIEQVSFVLASGFTGNFSRTVRVTARPDDDHTIAESLDGTILRVHLREVRKQTLSFPASLGANLQGDATVEVAIENGDDQPLPVAAVVLGMRERRICFEAPANAQPTLLFYGDPALSAPAYDYARIFSAAEHPVAAQLGPESPNPGFKPRADQRPFTERHPNLLWIALLLVVGLLGTVALRSSRRIAR